MPCFQHWKSRRESSGNFGDDMPITKELRKKIREANRTDCENGTCKHKYQYQHCPNHDASMWCQDCVGGNFKPVSQTLPDGTISKGFFMTNAPNE